MVVNGDELCCVHKPGGSPLSEEELIECIEKCKTRAKSIKELIDIAVKDGSKEICF